jgi:hypothetical protein
LETQQGRDMPARDINAYWRDGFPQVEGWLARELLDPLKCISRAQDDAKLAGNVAEIGVYRGKLLIALAHLAGPGERCVAIDIFDDQAKNIDGSGAGSMALLCENFQRHAPDGAELVTIKADSLAMTLDQRVALARDHGPFRLFSIDGGHTVQHALNDLLTAQDMLADGGVVLLDDIFHRHWPGVTEAVGLFYSRYVPRIAPFLHAYNKLFLVSYTYHAHFLRYAVEIFKTHPQFKVVRMFGSEAAAIS